MNFPYGTEHLLTPEWTRGVVSFKFSLESFLVIFDNGTGLGLDSASPPKETVKGSIDRSPSFFFPIGASKLTLHVTSSFSFDSDNRKWSIKSFLRTDIGELLALSSVVAIVDDWF